MEYDNTFLKHGISIHHALPDNLDIKTTGVRRIPCLKMTGYTSLDVLSKELDKLQNTIHFHELNGGIKGCRPKGFDYSLFRTLPCPGFYTPCLASV